MVLVVALYNSKIVLYPDFSEFARLGRDAKLVPIVKVLPADLLTPVAAFLALAQDEPHAFLLESVEGGEKVGRYTFLGVHPYKIVSAKGEQMTVAVGKKILKQKGDALSYLRHELTSRPIAPLRDLPPFTSGAVGFFAYDFIRQLERLPESAKDDLQVPDCIFIDRKSVV